MKSESSEAMPSLMCQPEPRTSAAQESGGSLHLNFLDGLRGLAAFYVVCHHFLAWSSPGLPRWAHYAVSWANFGHSAVGVFIVLSGFSLMLPVARSQNGRLQGGVRQYITRRARRILPPYYAALVISLLAVALSAKLPSLGSVLSHVVLLHNLNPRWCHDINMALWSVATEWQIYFVFPLLLVLWRRLGNAVTVIGAFCIGLLPLAAIHDDLSCACFWYIGLFALGMAGADLFARYSSSNKKQRYFNRLPLWSLGLSLAYIGAYFLLRAHSTIEAGYVQFYLGETLRDGLLGGLVLCLILFCSQCAVREEKPKPVVLRLLDSPISRTLGLFSYSLYLTHCIVLQVLLGLIKFLSLSPLMALALKTFVGLPVAVAFAYVFYLMFERPFLSGKAQRRRMQEQEEAHEKAPLP